MDRLQEIRSYATSLGLVHTKNELEVLIHEAETMMQAMQHFYAKYLAVKYVTARTKQRKDASRKRAFGIKNI